MEAAPQSIPAIVDHLAHGGRYRRVISVQRGEQHVPGPLDRSEVTAAGFLLVTAFGSEPAV
jgi:hypothetical protein